MRSLVQHSANAAIHRNASDGDCIFQGILSALPWVTHPFSAEMGLMENLLVVSATRSVDGAVVFAYAQTRITTQAATDRTIDYPQ